MSLSAAVSWTDGGINKHQRSLEDLENFKLYASNDLRLSELGRWFSAFLTRLFIFRNNQEVWCTKEPQFSQKAGEQAACGSHAEALQLSLRV